MRLAGECDADLLVIGNKGMQPFTYYRQRPEHGYAHGPLLVLVVKTT